MKLILKAKISFFIILESINYINSLSLSKHNYDKETRNNRLENNDSKSKLTGELKKTKSFCNLMILLIFFFHKVFINYLVMRMFYQVFNSEITNLEQKKE